MTKLKYLSASRLDTLARDVESNLERYSGTGFDDLVVEQGWSIEHTLDIDISHFKSLNPGNNKEAEIHNSRIVWDSLPGLTPNLACEERVWTRLAHIECIEYTRARWLSKPMGDTEVVSAVRDHFFARGRTGIRDDNAISRLWWNYYIARQALPDDPDTALNLIRKSADIRSNIVERPRTSCRQPLLAGVIRAMQDDEWLTASEDNFRNLMKVLNRDAGGLLLETMTSTAIDCFIAASARKARAA
jgi:hypothetical protein